MNKKSMIKKYRREIDKIHWRLILLIVKRNNICNKIRKLKNELGLPRIDIEREKQMIRDARKSAKRLEINDKVVIKIMNMLIRKNLGKRIR